MRSMKLVMAVALAGFGCGGAVESPSSPTDASLPGLTDASQLVALDATVRARDAAPAPDAGSVDASPWAPDGDPSTPDGGCSADLQCHGGTICQTCSQTCIFPPNAPCDPQAPCPCDYACVQQRCAANPDAGAATCTFDGDCPIDWFCNRALFQCQLPMFVTPAAGGPCAKNADCAFGYICSTAAGAPRCLLNPTVACRSTADCTGPNFCDTNNQCRRGGC